SALRFSSADSTLPCRVTEPSAVSTFTAVLETPAVVSRAIFALLVIHASETAAPAVTETASTAASKPWRHHVRTRIRTPPLVANRQPRDRRVGGRSADRPPGR